MTHPDAAELLVLWSEVMAPGGDTVGLHADKRRNADLLWHCVHEEKDAVLPCTGPLQDKS